MMGILQTIKQFFDEWAEARYEYLKKHRSNAWY